MRLHQILSENELKTLAEMDRRGFLKGIGAAALGTAAAAGTGNANAYTFDPEIDKALSGGGLQLDKNEEKIVDSAVELYAYCQFNLIPNCSNFQTNLKTALQKFASVPGGKKYLNYQLGIYRDIIKRVQAGESPYGDKLLMQKVRQAGANASTIIKDLASLNEF